MINDRTISELLEIYTGPNRYTIKEWRGEGGSTIPLNGWRVSLHRSKDYIEFIIRECDEQRLIITLPTTLASLEQARQRIIRIEQSQTMLFGEYEVRSVSFCEKRDPSRIIIADVVVQRVECGTPMDRYIEQLNPDEIQQLYMAVDKLEREMIASKSYFKEIAPQDIMVVEDELLYPYRLGALRFAFGHDYPSTSSGCQSLRNAIAQISGVEEIKAAQPQQSNSRQLGYPRRLRSYIDGYLWNGELHEDRIAVKSESGYGFIDSRYKVIVEPQYLAIDDFREGRAVVVSQQGTGLINIWGECVIPLIYDDIDYNPETGLSTVYKGDKWSYFSYGGDQLTPFDNVELREAQTTSSLSER